MPTRSIACWIITAMLLGHAGAADVPALPDVPLRYDEPAPSVDTVADGLKHATVNDGYLLVFVYGSTWSLRSVPTYERLWPSKDLRTCLGPGVAMFAADLPDAPSPEEQKRFDETIKGIDLKYDTVPAVLLYDKKGVSRGQVSGRVLEQDTGAAIQAISAMVRQARLRDLCLKYAEEHEESKPLAAVEALAIVARMGGTDPESVVDRIKTLDPSNASGWVDATTLTSYTVILEQVVEPMIDAATKDDQKEGDDKADDGKAPHEQSIDPSLAERIVTALRERMDNPHFTSEQQMHFLIAIGKAYERAGMKEPMIKAYQQAMEKEPGHWAGRAHYQRAMR